MGKYKGPTAALDNELCKAWIMAVLIVLGLITALVVYASVFESYCHFGYAATGVRQRQCYKWHTHRPSPEDLKWLRESAEEWSVRHGHSQEVE